MYSNDGKEQAPEPTAAPEDAHSDAPTTVWLCNVADPGKYQSLRAIFREVASSLKVKPSHASWCRKEGSPHKDHLWLRFSSSDDARVALTHTFGTAFGNSADNPVTCEPALKNRSSAFTQILITDIHSTVYEQDIIEMLNERGIQLSTTAAKPIHFYSVRRGGFCSARVHLANHEQYKKALQIQTLTCSVSHTVVHVKPYVSNIKFALCSHCRMPGHTKAKCLQTDDPPTCPRCGKPNHGDELCAQEATCPLCKQKAHGQYFNNPNYCPELRKIQRARTAHNKAKSQEYLEAVLGKPKPSPTYPSRRAASDDDDAQASTEVTETTAKLETRITRLEDAFLRISDKLDKLVELVESRQKPPPVSEDAQIRPTAAQSLSTRLDHLEKHIFTVDRTVNTLTTTLSQNARGVLPDAEHTKDDDKDDDVDATATSTTRKRDRDAPNTPNTPNSRPNTRSTSKISPTQPKPAKRAKPGGGEAS